MSALLARKPWFVYLAMLASLVSGRISLAASDEDMFASLRLGALQFQHRCAICHGSDGLGEGPLPMLIANYPNTNLMQPRVATDSKTAASSSKAPCLPIPAPSCRPGVMR
jgi:mono/diheme cytochrome c family protein